MKYDATLKKIFQNPPLRLLSLALGREVAISRALPTEFVSVANLHPDLLFEMADGELLHTEMHGYPFDDFPARNLIYFGVTLRDHGKAPWQVVFWLGPGKVGIGSGLEFPERLHYRFTVVDVREIDGDWLLEGGDPGEAVFAILCKLRDRRAAVAKILSRIQQIPVPKRREIVAQLLILSGLRGLNALVKEEIERMPVSIDIHENEFLEEVYQEGIHEGALKGARDLLIHALEVRFGALPSEARSRVQNADLAQIRQWIGRVAASATLDQLLQ